LWAQTNAEETVQYAMTKDEQGMYRAYNGVFVKWLPCFGDASAVALTKLLVDRPIADEDIPAILIVLSDSYGSPMSIEDAAERQPRTTLFLLRALSRVTSDPKILGTIDETAAYVKSQYDGSWESHSNSSARMRGSFGGKEIENVAHYFLSLVGLEEELCMG
jgi:hypothetical protein